MKRTFLQPDSPRDGSRTWMHAAWAAVLGLAVASGTHVLADDAPMPAKAATAPPAGGVINAPFDRIREAIAELDLTGEQKTKVEAVLHDSLAEFKSAAAGSQNATPEDRADTIRDLLKTIQDKISVLLNEKQRTEFSQKLDTFRLNLAGRAGPMIERLQGAVEKLELNDAQRTQARGVIQGAIQKMRQARGEAAGDAQAVREKSREVLEESRQKLKEMLSPEQQQKLMELMLPAAGANRPGAGLRRGAAAEPTPRKLTPPADPPPMIGDPVPQLGSDKASADAPKSTLVQSASATGALDPGKPAPNFTLNKLDGQPAPLSSFKNKVTVLVFGSYSAPTFREHAPDVDALRKELGSRANVLIVYTKESHPVGGWEVERNKGEGVQIEQPKDMESRIRNAKLARDALKIATPILVDTMDDATATAYDGFTNSAVVIGRDGNIVTREKWFEPYALRRAVDEAVIARPATRPAT